MNPVEDYFLRQEEPYRSIMLYVRSVIFQTLDHIDEKYSYSIPFYHYKKKPFMYLNVLKNQDFVDIAFVKGRLLKDDFPQLKDYNNRKNVRSLQFRSLEKLDDDLLKRVLLAAADLDDKSRTGWYD